MVSGLVSHSFKLFGSNTMKTVFLPLVIALSVATFADAQQIVKLPNTSVVVVKSTEEIDAKNARAGQEFIFAVAADVNVDGHTLISSGAPVIGTVANAEEQGAIGKGAKLSITLRSVTAVDGQNVQLTGDFVASGDSKTGEKVALGVIICPLLLLGKGKPAVIASGTQVRALTVGDYNIKVST